MAQQGSVMERGKGVVVRENQRPKYVTYHPHGSDFPVPNSRLIVA